MSDKRYASHHALGTVGAQGQSAIRNAHVLLIGLGGLGCATASYLVASGVGDLTLCDFDTVAESNLARQVLYNPTDIGRAKVEAASAKLQELNPETRLHAFDTRMAESDVAGLLADCDIVIDASDNYGTRLAVNRACLATGKPWVMGSCVRMEGQLALFRTGDDQPCYHCIYGSAPDTLEDCPGAGIFAPVAGVIGAAMAQFALGHLAGAIETSGLHVLDAQRWEWRNIKVSRKRSCPDCGA